ncbi:FAD-dependent oxidoreductase [Persicimonas caeni]|nr:NAD(P)/FAD-dependent oxidoreductase [Persicimonas caeni]
MASVREQKAPKKMTVVGAGPVGCVLAMLLAKRGHDVEMYEMRPDMRAESADGGRSINLVLTDRGLRALEMFGLREKVLEITVPVLGRMMHSVDGELAYQPYGKDDSECNYSVSRGELNKFLLDAAEEMGITIHFEKTCTGADFDTSQLHFEGSDPVDAGVIFGADGAPSAVRKALVEAGAVDDSVEMLEYGYKELIFPAADGGEPAMAGHALHIWPRGDHFLMGLANLDGSFTGTIYLPWKGEHGFEELDSVEKVRAFFEEFYPDAIPLLGEDFEEEYLSNPNGKLGTVRCKPWHLGDRALLIGDAAHGIVPFFGQGLNCGFEDCVVLDEVFTQTDDLAEAFSTFDTRRKPNSDAIADMALENFVEMRDKVGDPHFLLKKAVEHRLENEFTDIYRSRYAMVMYSYIPYSVAYSLGEVQQEILEELCADIERPEDADMEHARELIEQKLVPLYDQHDVDLSF